MVKFSDGPKVRASSGALNWQAARRVPNAASTNPLNSVVYKIADCRAEREAAFGLVHEMYASQGLISPNAYRMRVTPWHLLDGANVYIAKRQGRVIYTMSAVPDGGLGLPLESIYGSEVHARRQSGVRLAEVTCLAACQEAFSCEKMFQVFVRLVGLMFQSCRFDGIERVLIAVHPRHGRFYHRALGFDQIGEVKPYASVCGHPAVAYEHDFSRLDANPYKLYEAVYEHRFNSLQLAGWPMGEAEREFFGMVSSFADACDLSFAA